MRTLRRFVVVLMVTVGLAWAWACLGPGTCSRTGQSRLLSGQALLILSVLLSANHLLTDPLARR